MEKEQDQNETQIKEIEDKIALFNDISNKIGFYLKITKFEYSEKDEADEEEPANKGPILQIENLQKYYSTEKKVLDDITFNVNAGEFFGIVGESGSGKSTLGKTIIRIIPNSGGTILFDGKYISSRHLPKSTKRWLSQNIQMVFQSPISSLNPKKKVLDLIKEPLTRSTMISSKVDTLIELHKILNFIFKDRIQILTLEYKNEYARKYYATLIFAYFTFSIKFAIYNAYMSNINGTLNLDEFLNNISPLYTKYQLGEDALLVKGYYDPLYEIENINELDIYKKHDLTEQQKAELLKNFLSDNKLLDNYEINLNQEINAINDLFNEPKDANDFIIAAIDELDNNVKQVLGIGTKYFQKITEVTRTILKKISRKDYLPKESIVIETYNHIQELKDEYEHNPIYDKIEKIIAKRQNALAEFNEEFKQSSGFDAKELFNTYLEAAKEEENSVKRSLINHAEQPFLFIYFEIKQVQIEEQIRLIKQLSVKKNLTYKQIVFLIEKLNLLIAKKYEPLYEELKLLKKDEDNYKGKIDDLMARINVISNLLEQMRANNNSDLSQYQIIDQLSESLISENLNIVDNNAKLVDEQVNALKKINEEAQEILNENRNQFLKQEIDEEQAKYRVAVKEYIKESDEYDAYSEVKVNQLNEEFTNIVNSYDPFLNELISLDNSYLRRVGRVILAQAKDPNNDASNNKDIVRDIKRVQEGIASTFSELEEILNNTRTYLHLYRNKNPEAIKKKLVKHLTKLYVFETLESVGLKQEHAFRYIYDFSGGQRQRIAIARALITNPKLIIADEPISALDVSIQAQVVNIMKNLAKERNITFLFIAHDLSMVHYACDRIIIINKGHILEKGDTEAIFSNPGHPYTRTLLKAVPELENINLDLAKESEKVDQPYSAYNPIESPKFYRLDNTNHFVYGTKEQVQTWNKDSIITKD